MARTQVNARQILNGSIQQEDIDITTEGKAIIVKVEPGAGVALNSTGADSGTGVVTISFPGYHHIQALADTDWVIQHNLGKFPTMVVADENGSEIIGDVVFTGINQLTVSFNIPVSGQAYLS